MRALVTGASGFIGSTLVQELNTLGFEVHALMRRNSSPKNLERMNYQRVEGDVTNFDSLKNAVKGMDYVFHLAGATAAANREAYLAANAHPTELLARAAAEVSPSLTRFVFVSSLAAGGPAQSLSPRTEKDPDQPVSAYGDSKLEAEKVLLKFKHVFPVSILRPPIVYGPKDKAVFVLIKTVARNIMPIIQGGSSSGKKHYSSIHVRDLCRGIVQSAVTVPSPESGEVYYLSDDGVHSYEEFLSSMAEALDCDPFRFKVPQRAVQAAAWAMSGLGFLTRRSFPLNIDKLNEILPDYWICSNEKAKAQLGFRPELDLAKGMAQTIEWYRQHKWL